MWLRVIRHAGEVARSIRKEKNDLLLRELPQLFCWYCAFCTKVGISLEDAVWRFFPGICPTCYVQKCKCAAYKESDSNRGAQKDAQMLLRFQETNMSQRPRTLDEYVTMFDVIYGSHDEAAHIDSIFLHLTEELGEVAKHIHSLKQLDGEARRELIDGDLSSELADVFSWICKLCSKANAQFRGFMPYLQQQLSADGKSEHLADIRLSGLIEAVYGGGCPECKLMRCSSDCPGWNIEKSGNSKSS